ncbi:MAG TPA: RNA pseudouridine synthase, partial [Saprospiraceae bacterium]|nr:RNA pseudouridine synthase [Saprospiraceae bacterium]
MPYFRKLEGLDGPEPELFTQPFDYEPHPWVKAAAADLQQRMAEEINHNFGIHSGENGLGKMMGVLVVKNKEGVLGYL